MTQTNTSLDKIVEEFNNRGFVNRPTDVAWLRTTLTIFKAECREKRDKEILEAYCNYAEHCIATDAEYTDKEMVDILSAQLKRTYTFITSLLSTKK